MNREIANEAAHRGISRLCHFTPARKLPNILAGEKGVLSSMALQQQDRHVFDATDLERWDGHPGHVCCSIEYPNSWYFRKAQAKETLFKDWVVLFINPTYLAAKNTLFAPANAAAKSGALLASGTEAFRRLYGPRGGERCPRRSADHLPCSPTDDQAEVLVPDGIPFADVLGIAVRSSQQALLETERLAQAGLDASRLKLVVAPLFWEPNTLATFIRSGRRPQELEWTALE